jgi:hypothetical protein
VTRAYVLLVSVVAIVAGFGCASVPAPEIPKDPGRIAHDARVASERACNAYDAAVKLGAIPPNAKADRSCATVRGVCSDPSELAPE